jgi:ribosomal protein S18 acetylase RimI-like enzyme
VILRPTTDADLDFVLALEHRPDNRDFIGQWPRAEHQRSMARDDRQHLLMESADGTPLGYLIGYDVRAAGFGWYVKRIAVEERSRGIGRAALAEFAMRAWTAGAALVSLAVRPHNLRAQRCYHAVGFVEWALNAGDRIAFLERVDPFATDCLVMRLITKRTKETKVRSEGTKLMERAESDEAS